jgi:AAHS family 4-hydroxybenzoate transporter-like MFS transporter
MAAAGPSSIGRTIDVGEFINSRKLTSFNVILVVVSWLITVFDGFDQMTVSYTMPYMREALHLKSGMQGNVFAIGNFGMLCGGFAFAYLGDRIGRRPTVIAAACTFAVLTFITGFVQDYAQLLTLRFCDGFAIGGMLPLAWALNIEFVPRRMRATVVSLVMLGYSMGTAVAAPITNVLAPKFGWSAVYFAGGGGTLLCAILLFLFLPESIRFLSAKGLRPDLIAKTLNRMQPSLAAKATDTFVVADEALQRTNFKPAQLFSGWLKWLTILLWVGYTLSSLAIYFDANWGPTVIEKIGFPRAQAANLIGLSTILGAGLGLCIMRFTDKLGPFTVALYPLLAIPVLLFIGLGHPSKDILPLLLVVGPTLISGGHFGILSICGVFYPSVIRANGAGWATSIAKIGAIAGPAVAGYLLDAGVVPIHLFALVAICPMILAACAVGIGFVVRGERNKSPSPIGAAQAAAAE